MGRWQAPVDPSLHAVSGPLGAQALLDRKRPRRFTPPGKRCVMRSSTWSPGAWNIARWRPSGPSASMRSSTPKATNT